MDPGSLSAAFVCFVDGRPKISALVKAKPKDHWQARLSSIGADLNAPLFVFDPDVIAIEKVVAHMNIGVAITMAKTIGYLVRTLEVMYPTAVWIEVPKASVCHAIGIKGNARRLERQEAARKRFPNLASQDEADAGAVGLGAMLLMKEA